MTANLYAMPASGIITAPKTTLRQTASVEISSLNRLFNQYPETYGGRQVNSQYVLIWCRKGKGKLVTPVQQYELSCNTVYCLSPMHTYSLLPSEQTDGYTISLPNDFFSQYEHGVGNSFFSSHIDGLKQPAVIPVDDAMRQDMEQVLVCMQREILMNTALTAEIVRGLIKVFLLYLSRKLVVDNGFSMGRDALMVKKFMELLEGRFVSMKKVSDYASELCVTPGYLTQVVKKVSGFTPSHHIQQMILCEAKRLATLNAHHSMKEIAYSLGFEDLAHFSKFFKANAGANFTSFRRASLG